LSSLTCIFPFCLYLQQRRKTSMAPVASEPATPASDRPQSLALKCSPTGTASNFDPRTVQPQQVAIWTTLFQPTRRC
jgi:hypothetical protein